MTTRMFAMWMLVSGLGMACTHKEEGPEEMGGQEGEAFDLDGSPGFDDEGQGGTSSGGDDGGANTGGDMGAPAAPLPSKTQGLPVRLQLATGAVGAGPRKS